MEAARAEGGDSRKLTLSFSSEAPYRRYFGLEILDHGEGAVDLGRLNGSGVLLFNHHVDQVLGKVLRAWVENGKGYAEVEFDTDAEAEKIFAKVRSGTLKTTSVRYQVDSWEEVKAGASSADGRFAGPCSIARKWTPLEVSIVSVPADASVGVGRSKENHEQEEMTMDEDDVIQQTPGTEGARSAGAALAPGTTLSTGAAPAAGGTPAPEGGEASPQARAAERQRVLDIMALCRQTGMEAEQYIQNDSTLDQVRAAAVEHLIQHGAPVVTGARDSSQDNFRDAARDALLMQAGMEVKDPAQGVEDFRGMSLRDVLIESMARSGEGTATELLRRSRADLWDTAVRQFLSPTADFPAILDNAIRKSLVQQYSLVPATFELWTGRGSLTDLKVTKDHEYALGGGKFYKVSEGGELKHSTLQTEFLPTRNLDSFGTQFTMTREAFINDDIGFLAAMPAQYARAAKRQINRDVYNKVYENPAVFDGAALFDAAHKNLVSPGTAPSIDAMTRMITMMGLQTDQFGESIMVEPAAVIVPVGWGILVSQILNTAVIDVDGIGSHTVNVLNTQYRSKVKVIEEGALNVLAGANACPWFMAADPMQTKSVQVDYLNGVTTPSFRRSEKAGYLGFIWDIWLDWGVNIVDFRGILRNNGAKLTV